VVMRIPRARLPRLTKRTCSHAGPDCRGPIQREHLIYGSAQQTTHLCEFHNQAVQQIRRLLALRKREVGLRPKLDERQRVLCFEEMRKWRFARGFPQAMHDKCEAIAASLRLAPRTDWYERLSSQDTPKPGGPIKFRPEPIATGSPVEEWDWKITISNPEMMKKRQDTNSR
jgi:hypothetical protein